MPAHRGDDLRAARENGLVEVFDHSAYRIDQCAVVRVVSVQEYITLSYNAKRLSNGVFVGEDGRVCPCYVEATKEIDDTDIMIGLLNAELTPNIHPAKILPPDYEKYIGDGGGIPVVTFNQHENAFLTYMTMIFTDPKVRMLCGREPADPKQKLFRRQIIVGDSGDPAFLLIGNHPILLYCLYGGGCGSGHALHRKRYQIQTAMDELCPGYRLESFDFSVFKNKAK